MHIYTFFCMNNECSDIKICCCIYCCHNKGTTACLWSKVFKTRFFHFCVYHWLECDITHETGLPPALMTCSPFSDAAKQRHTSSRSGCIRMDLWLSVEGSMSHLQGLSNGIFFFCSRFPRIWMKKCAEKQFWASWIGFCIRTYLKKKFLTFLGGLFNYQPLHSNF